MFSYVTTKLTKEQTNSMQQSSSSEPDSPLASQGIICHLKNSNVQYSVSQIAQQSLSSIIFITSVHIHMSC
jgi:hypothetical protein